MKLTKREADVIRKVETARFILHDLLDEAALTRRQRDSLIVAKGYLWEAEQTYGGEAFWEIIEPDGGGDAA